MKARYLCLMVAFVASLAASPSADAGTQDGAVFALHARSHTTKAATVCTTWMPTIDCDEYNTRWPVGSEHRRVSGHRGSRSALRVSPGLPVDRVRGRRGCGRGRVRLDAVRRSRVHQRRRQRLSGRSLRRQPDRPGLLDHQLPAYRDPAGRTSTPSSGAFHLMARTAGLLRGSRANWNAGDSRSWRWRTATPPRPIPADGHRVPHRAGSSSVCPTAATDGEWTHCFQDNAASYGASPGRSGAPGARSSARIERCTVRRGRREPASGIVRGAWGGGDRVYLSVSPDDHPGEHSARMITRVSTARMITRHSPVAGVELMQLRPLRLAALALVLAARPRLPGRPPSRLRQAAGRRRSW